MRAWAGRRRGEGAQGIGQLTCPSRPQQADLSKARKWQERKDTSSRHKASSPEETCWGQGHSWCAEAGLRLSRGTSLLLGRQLLAPLLLCPSPSTTSVLETQGSAQAPGPHCPALGAPQGGLQAQSLALCPQVAPAGCWAEGLTLRLWSSSAEKRRRRRGLLVGLRKTCRSAGPPGPACPSSVPEGPPGGP